jgi:hypothetical protein
MEEASHGKFSTLRSSSMYGRRYYSLINYYSRPSWSWQRRPPCLLPCNLEPCLPVRALRACMQNRDRQGAAADGITLNFGAVRERPPSARARAASHRWWGRWDSPDCQSASGLRLVSGWRRRRRRRARACLRAHERPRGADRVDPVVGAERGAAEEKGNLLVSGRRGRRGTPRPQRSASAAGDDGGASLLRSGSAAACWNGGRGRQMQIERGALRPFGHITSRHVKVTCTRGKPATLTKLLRTSYIASFIFTLQRHF